MTYKIVAIKHCSAGNETVGEMWHETKIFEIDTPIEKIMKWAGNGYLRTKTDVVITVTEVEDSEL